MSDTNSPPAWQRAISTSKDLLPYLMLLYQAVYGFGVRTSTSDRVQQQQQEDHVAIMELRTSVSSIAEKQSAMAARIDMLIAASFRSRP